MTEKTETTEKTHAQWRDEGIRRFGSDELAWRFVCPSCGHVASTQDYKDAGAPVETVAYSCIGRWLPGTTATFGQRPGPCNYTGGGLFKINPVHVICAGGNGHGVFEFAPPNDEAGALP